MDKGCMFVTVTVIVACWWWWYDRAAFVSDCGIDDRVLVVSYRIVSNECDAVAFVFTCRWISDARGWAPSQNVIVNSTQDIVGANSKFEMLCKWIPPIARCVTAFCAGMELNVIQIHMSGHVHFDILKRHASAFCINVFPLRQLSRHDTTCK